MWENVSLYLASQDAQEEERSDLAERAKSAIERLTEREKSILLALGDGRTMQEIGDELGISKQAVSKIATTAREQVIRAL